MKRFLAVLFCCFLFVRITHAEAVNPSSLSFEEIQEQLDTYNLKIWRAGNWSSVVVPDGNYVVGVDLPAGEYTVRSCTYKMNSYLELIPVGCDLEKYYYDPRYLDLTLKSSDDQLIELIDGDQIVVNYAGTQFLIKDYMPRFNPDPEQEAEVGRLKNEYDNLLAELKSRPEWREVTVPEGMYEVGPKIPADHWTIWPKDTRAAVYYGKGLDAKGDIFNMIITAPLKDQSLYSFQFGYHQGWVSIDAQEGWYVKIEDTVIFTPYIGATPFQFNE